MNTVFILIFTLPLLCIMSIGWHADWEHNKQRKVQAKLRNRMMIDFWKDAYVAGDVTLDDFEHAVMDELRKQEQ